MEYQQKKEQILTSVEYSNLLGFTLVENKLERNFRAIVEALMLNQAKTEDVLSKTDQLDDRITLERQKAMQEQEAFRQAIKQLSQRVAKLENQPSSNRNKDKSQSSKNIKEVQRVDTVKKESAVSDIVQPAQKNSFLDKKIEDAFLQISAIKDKLPGLKLMENQLESMKRDITMVKGQLMAAGKSAKSIKRESINPTKPSFRRQSSSKIGKGPTLSHSSSSVLLQDTDNKENRSIHVEAKEKQQTNASNVISNSDNDLDKELEGLHIEVNTLNLCYEEVKNLVEDLRKKDIRYHSIISQLEDKQRRMQDELRRDSETFEKNIKGIQLQMMNFQHQEPKAATKSETPEEKESGKRSSGSSRENSNTSPQAHSLDQNSINYKNQLNDRISKLQNSLLGFITQNQFNRFKGQTRTKLQQLQKKHDKLVNEYQQEIKKIYDMFINKDLDMNRLGEMISSTSETIKENHSQAERKHNIAIARCEELKKNLQNLREDVEFYQAMNTENKETKEKKDEGKKSQGDAKSPADSAYDPKAIQDLKKYFNNKLHDQRAYLVGLIRDLQKKQSTANAVNQQIANLWDKINEINIFLNKKGDAEDIKKNLIYLEKKINKISAQLVKADDNTQDARIARTNWFCLSCDKNLQGYQGKPGKHMVWDSMPLKGVVKVDKKGLPSLKK